MYSFNFPEMIGSTTSKLLRDKDAVRSNLILLLGTEKTSLFGDPYFGSQLKQFLFEQSNRLIIDLVIDELYTAITTFIPQVFIERKNIKVYTDKRDLYAEVSYIYKIDNTSDLYSIKLTDSENT